jgi:hypothetical protein
LISASTRAAGAPSWSAVGLSAGEAAGEAVTDGEGGALIVGDMADADGAALARRGPAAGWRGGTVTTTGAAATAIAAGALAQGLASAAPHPATVARELVTVPAEDGPGENAPRARYRLPPIRAASASAAAAAILARRGEAGGAGVP